MSKVEKEAAVFGHTGTSLQETAAIASSAALLMIVSKSRNIAEDILEIVFPLVLAETVAETHLPLGVYTIPLCCLIVWYIEIRSRSLPSPSVNSDSRYVISVLRASTVLLTVIAILAVDFPSVFPRRFAKTEWFGAGLMDLGVGAYVFTGAIVRGTKKRNLSRRELLTTAFVFGMGFVRAYVNKSLDYQEHVSEYGVHWNFFITLAFVKLVTDLFSRFVGRQSPSVHFLCGLFVLVGHQTVLSTTILGNWVNTDGDVADRRQYSLIWQNKEGIISLPGYVALDLCTKGISAWLTSSINGRHLFVLNFAIWIILIIVRITVEDICRRSANAAYCLWITAIGTMIIAITVTMRSQSGGREVRLVNLISQYQLPVFVLANLLTGAVNLSMNTLLADRLTAILILSVYSSTVCLFAWFMDLILTSASKPSEPSRKQG